MALPSFFTCESAVQGYHIYQEILEASCGQTFPCVQEEGNLFDLFTVSVVRAGSIISVACCTITAAKLLAWNISYLFSMLCNHISYAVAGYIITWVFSVSGCTAISASLLAWDISCAIDMMYNVSKHNVQPHQLRFTVPSTVIRMMCTIT